jgi:CMP/dCMP kinase
MVKAMEKFFPTDIITIAGRPGSGKSTAAKGVATELGFSHFSSGDLFRAVAKELGFDVLQANLSAEQDAELDHRVDGRLRELGETSHELVIDSRTAWHWIPNSFKVFLDLDLEIGAQRILGSMTEERRATEHVPSDPKEYAKQLQRRLDSESGRYKKLYDIDPYDMSHYDLVINTGEHTPEEVAAVIITGFRQWHQRQTEQAQA